MDEAGQPHEIHPPAAHGVLSFSAAGLANDGAGRHVGIMARFLVIDDDNTLRTLITMTLEGAGHSVAAAASGHEASRLFREQAPDVVITDIIMPADSIEQVVALRNEHPSIPFIVVSGLVAGSVPTLEATQLLNARRTLTKPFNLADLLDAVNAVLAGPPICPPATETRH